MVVCLGPGKLYGSSLPRPRFYTAERVDLPPSAMDLLNYIEGNIIFNKSPSPKKSAEAVINRSPSSPRAPLAIKRRRRAIGLLEVVRKLEDDFERVARESGMTSNTSIESGGSEAARTRGKNNKTNVIIDEEGVKKGKKKLVKIGGCSMR